MKLGIVELCTSNHHTMIYNWMHIGEINKWDITIYITREIYNNVRDQLSTISCNWAIQDGGTLGFLWKIRSDLRAGRIDKVIFLTLQNNYIPFLFLPLRGMNYGITVHNVNLWFKTNHIRKPTDLIKRYFRYRLRRSARFFIVNSQNMKDYIDVECTNHKPTFVVPFSMKRIDAARPQYISNLRVVYPGAIDTSRKIYHNFIRLAKQYPNDEFILLGTSSKGSEMVLRQAESESNIRVYHSFIPVEEFNNEILSAHLLFSEIVVNFNGDDMSEMYGITKDSGVSYLMAEFGIPAILNSDFRNFKELSCSTIQFEDYQDLSDKFASLHSSDILRKLNSGITKEVFSLKRFSKSIVELETC